MGCFSTIDHQTRLDLHEIVARYCQYLDHDRGACFAQLFHMDGVFEKASGMRLVGHDAIATLPAKIARAGDGCWRHVATNLMIDRGVDNRSAIVNAYVMVMDWANGGKPIGICDTRFEMRRSQAWRIARVHAAVVGMDGEAPVMSARETREAVPA